MNARGISIDDATFGLVFAAASSADDSEVGLNFLQHAMDNVDYQPTVQVMNGAIELCAATHNPGGALELFNSMEASGLLVPDEKSYIQVIRALARVGNVKKALTFATAMKDRLGYCSVDSYNRVLQACAVSGHSEQALSVLEDMTQQEGLVPDVVTFEMILKAFVKAGAIHAKRVGGNKQAQDDIDEEYPDGEEWLPAEGDSDSTQSPSNTQLSRVGDVIVSLLSEMHRYGIAPSGLTYSRAVSACAVRGDREGVLKVFDDLIAVWKRSAGLDNMTSLFSDVTLSEYITACQSSQDSERLLELAQLLGDDFQRSDGHGAVSSRVLLELMNAFESVGKWRRALQMLRDMDMAYGVTPSVMLFNRVMEMCNAAGEHQSVHLIFLTMQNSLAYLVDPNVGSYIQAIYAAEQMEEWTRATNLFLAMQQNCPKEEIRPADLQKIALGRYSERPRHDEGGNGGGPY
jgi:pentatricopeptide repeat protein